MSAEICEPTFPPGFRSHLKLIGLCRCGQECSVKCLEPMRGLEVTLPCGHIHDSPLCWQAQNPSEILCGAKVFRRVPHCEHRVELPCFVDAGADTFICEATCDVSLPCESHYCQQRCGRCTKGWRGHMEEANRFDCQLPCRRAYRTCTHRCEEPCHGDTECPPCKAACEVLCQHSTCTKRCHEPCVPCVADVCSSSCPHGNRCTLPCAAPCDWIPCSKRCAKALDCGHQCPSICGEVCSSPKYCQTCCSEDIKTRVVDLMMCEEYQQVDLDRNPCVIPPCGHLLTVQSMDSKMDMAEHYTSDRHGVIVGLLDPAKPFSQDLKVCIFCQGPLGNISRYGRIFRRRYLDDATRKVITCANRGFLPLSEVLYEEGKFLADTAREMGPTANREAAVDLFVVEASNFARGTTAADIESALASETGDENGGSGMLSCRLIKTSPVVVAELMFCGEGDGRGSHLDIP